MNAALRIGPVFPTISQSGHVYGLANDEMRPEQADILATRLITAEARLTDALDQITDLRTRLDEERSDRRQALDRLAAVQERIAALLTDQRATPPAPPPRSWLPWQRRG